MQSQSMLYPSESISLLSSEGEDFNSDLNGPTHAVVQQSTVEISGDSPPIGEPAQFINPSEVAECGSGNNDSDSDEDDSDSDSLTSTVSRSGVPAESTSDKYFTHFSLEELRDMDSWKIEDPALQDSIEWAIWKLKRSVSNAAFDSRPTQETVSPLQYDDRDKYRNMSFTRLMKKMISLTGLRPQRIVCCVKSCALYKDPSVAQCSHCDEELYEKVNLLSGSVRRPRKNFFYFSPIPRLILNWAIPDRAQEMRNYVSVMLDNKFNHENLVRDFFDSTHYKRLRREGYFQDLRTLALVHSADGASVVKQKNKSVWLFLLTVLNLPPEERYRSMMITGLIPGEPRDLASFFQPLLRDLALLSEGVDAIDGSLSTRPHFTLKAHLSIITGDFPAISKMMDMKGANGHAPCRFCLITGTYHEGSRHTYYPLNGRNFTTGVDGVNDSSIGLRTNLREQILLVTAARSEELRRLHGINGRSAFLDVSTIHFPASRGLDIMHLFTNVAKLFWTIWSGKLLPPSFEEASAESYVLSEAQMTDIGQAMEAASVTVPVSVSRLPRSIHKHVNSFKATEWYSWIMIYSVPLLRDKLPNYALQHWSLFSEAVRLCVQVQLSANDIDLIGTKLRQFVETAESIYYQNLTHRLPVCTSQLHSLLHVAANLYDLGPSYVTWQFGLERYVGCLAPLATSKSQIDTSMCNGLERLENMRYLKLMYKLQDCNRRKERSNSTELLDSNGEKYGALLGKGRKKTMTKRLNRTLNTWYSTDRNVMDCKSSMECIEWSKAQRLVTIGTAQEFTIATKTTGSDKARARNYVSFRDPDTGGLGYGQVISFFRHQCPISGSEISWALLDSFILICDTLTGYLYFERTEHKAGSRLIDIHDIVAPVGLLQRTQQTGSWWIAQGYRILA